MKTKVIVSIGVLLTSVAQVSQAVSIDLTTVGSSGTINGGYFEQVVTQPSGTGVIDSFVRIQNQGGSTTESGYNSSVRPVMPDVKTDPNFTRDILLASVPKVTLGIIDYYQFLLDLDEPNSANQGLITLYELQIFTKTGALTSANNYTDLTSGATLVWDLDSGVDSKIELKDLNAGNGQADMFAYIPVSALGTDLTKNVYLYSSFGIPEAADGSFEEWAVLKSTSDDGGGGGGGGGRVPDGGTTLVSLGVALLGLGTMRKLVGRKA